MAIYCIKFAQKHRISTDGRTDGQTDRRTDGQTATVNPVYPPPLTVGGGYNKKIKILKISFFFKNTIKIIKKKMIFLKNTDCFKKSWLFLKNTEFWENTEFWGKMSKNLKNLNLEKQIKFLPLKFEKLLKTNLYFTNQGPHQWPMELWQIWHRKITLYPKCSIITWYTAVTMVQLYEDLIISHCYILNCNVYCLITLWYHYIKLQHLFSISNRQLVVHKFHYIYIPDLSCIQAKVFITTVVYMLNITFKIKTNLSFAQIFDILGQSLMVI